MHRKQKSNFAYSLPTSLGHLDLRSALNIGTLCLLEISATHWVVQATCTSLFVTWFAGFVSKNRATHRMGSTLSGYILQ